MIESTDDEEDDEDDDDFGLKFVPSKPDSNELVHEYDQTTEGGEEHAQAVKESLDDGLDADTEHVLDTAAGISTMVDRGEVEELIDMALDKEAAEKDVKELNERMIEMHEAITRAQGDNTAAIDDAVQTRATELRVEYQRQVDAVLDRAEASHRDERFEVMKRLLSDEAKLKKKDEEIAGLRQLNQKLMARLKGMFVAISKGNRLVNKTGWQVG